MGCFLEVIIPKKYQRSYRNYPIEKLVVKPGDQKRVKIQQPIQKIDIHAENLHAVDSYEFLRIRQLREKFITMKNYYTKGTRVLFFKDLHNIPCHTDVEGPLRAAYQDYNNKQKIVAGLPEVSFDEYKSFCDFAEACEIIQNPSKGIFYDYNEEELAAEAVRSANSYVRTTLKEESIMHKVVSKVKEQPERKSSIIVPGQSLGSPMEIKPKSNEEIKREKAMKVLDEMGAESFDGIAYFGAVKLHIFNCYWEKNNKKEHPTWEHGAQLYLMDMPDDPSSLFIFDYNILPVEGT